MTLRERILATAARLAPVALVTVIGLLVRVWPAMMNDFPLHDGGMFAAMVGDIRAFHAIPLFTSYNGMQIPFAYPPLALLAAAILPVDPLITERFVPAIIASLTVSAVYLIARELTLSHVRALFASLLFAFIPAGFAWLVIGGGLTRAPGFLLALLGLWQLFRLQRTGAWRQAIAAGALLGLTILTHPEATLFAGVTSLFILLRARSSRRLFVRTAAAGIFAATIAAPWAVLVVARYGPGPLISAMGTGSDLPAILMRLLLPGETGELLVPVAFMLCFLGIAVNLADRRFFLPIWLVLVLLSNSRGAATFAMVPLAILAAVGFVDGLLGRVMRLPVDDVDSPAGSHVLAARGARGAFAFVVLLLGISGFIAGLVRPENPVRAEARAAMAWVRSETPANARFAVVEDRPWYDDTVSEWFPMLAGRQSAATPQGFEWLGAARWSAQQAAYDALQACTDSSCLATWMDAHGSPWVLIDGTNTAGLRATVLASPDFAARFSDGGVLIAERR